MNQALQKFKPHPREAWRLETPEFMERIAWQIANFPSVILPNYDTPAAICGIIHQFGVGEVWMIASADFKSHWDVVLPQQRRICADMFKALGLHRMHMLVDPTWRDARVYARALGFRKEFDKPARGMGPLGQDLDFYLWPKKTGEQK